MRCISECRRVTHHKMNMWHCLFNVPLLYHGNFAEEKTMEHLPLVSIITPTCNHEKYIGRCVKSVLAQTYSN